MAENSFDISQDLAAAVSETVPETTSASQVNSAALEAVPEPAGRLTFPKCERLRHRCAVTRLFDEGASEYAYPLRMFYLTVDEAELDRMFHGYIPADMAHLQMMVTVPKKKFKHAVDRVWLRRRIRESYRLNRLSLRATVQADASGRYLLLAFIYVGAEKRGYESINKKMVKLLDKAATIFNPPKEVAPKETEAKETEPTAETSETKDNEAKE